jgi:hypothetical protein
MAMQKFTVDGVNSLLIAKSGVTEVDVQVDLYSDAKEHWLTTDDSKFEFPLRTVAGDPIGGGKYVGDHYFLGNGWKIRPQEADHELLCVGNLWLDEGETGGIFVPTVGAFTVLALIERSADAIGISPTSLADEVWNRLESQILTPNSIGLKLKTNLDVAVSSRAAPGDQMALTAAERSTLAIALWNIADEVEAGVSPIQCMRAIGAVLAGLVTGGPGTPTFKSMKSHAKDRVYMEADANGNRTLVTLDLT